MDGRRRWTADWIILQEGNDPSWGDQIVNNNKKDRGVCRIPQRYNSNGAVRDQFVMQTDLQLLSIAAKLVGEYKEKQNSSLSTDSWILWDTTIQYNLEGL